MNKAHLPISTSSLLSISLVVGIFVAGLTSSRLLPAAGAQSSTGVSVAAPYATLAGGVISARGVVINGVATDALLVGNLRIVDSVVESRCGITPLGVGGSGESVYALGVFTSGNRADSLVGPNGVFTSGNLAGSDEPVGPNGVFTSGNVYVGRNLQVVGGSLSGGDIQIHGGIVSGNNMSVVGAYVTGDCAR